MAITIAPHLGRVRVRFNGATVADSAKALVLREGSYPPVLYLPRADADLALVDLDAAWTFLDDALFAASRQVR